MEGLAQCLGFYETMQLCTQIAVRDAWEAGARKVADRGLDLKCLGQCTSILTDSSALGMCRVVVQDTPGKRGVRSNQLVPRAPWAKPEALWLGMRSL